MRLLLRKLGGIGSSFPILLVLAALCVASIFIIKSATVANEALQHAYSAQFGYLIVGAAIYLVLALTPYSIFVRISPVLYATAVILLVAVFIPHLGRKAYNAYSWIKIGPIGFEPTEYAKLAFILGLAWFLHLRENAIQRLSTVLMAFGFTAIPFILILKQPALGSASVFFPICFCMLFAAGARPHHLLIPLVAVATLTVVAYYWIHVWEKPVPFLKDFQRHRIEVFFDPSLDPKGSGWQVDQSLIAIGSGGMDGKGFDEGTDTALGYLPKNTSYNDLIFAVAAELTGFRGAAALIICEGTVLLWCLWVAARAREKTGALVVVGIMAMLFTHVFVNIGMTIRLVPITGIPLPFISYGGTFVIACLAAMGLVQSVWVHRKNFDRI
jgi:rod shape determining protein RodA